MTSRRLPRPLHPGAWWLWASGAALAASRTTNPLLLVLIVAAAAFVVGARRQPSPWSRSFGVFLRLGLAAIAIRVVLFAVLAPAPGHDVLFRLPQVPLPGWLAGVRLGGPVAVGGVLAAAYDGLRLATVLVCIGAANALTSPRRLLRSLPAALYEAGVALTVAVAFVPHAVAAVGRVRAARRLRGRHERGLRALRGVALPVLDSALERSVDLAAAMEARGFGRAAGAATATRRATVALTVAGLVAMLASTYALLDRTAPQALGLPLLLSGAAVTAGGFVLGARRGSRSRYRPQRWGAADAGTACCGLLTAGLFSAATAGLSTPVAPVTAPALPLLPALGVLLLLLPAWLSPPATAPLATPTSASARVREAV